MLLDKDGNPIQETQDQPTFVDRKDFDTLAGLVQGMQQTMAAGFNALAAQRQTQNQPAAETIEDVSDEEIEQALNAGTGATTFRKMVDSASRRIVRDHIVPMKDQGTGAIAGLVKQLSTDKLPHYKKFQKEIDEYVEQLPPEQRMNPKAYEVAHQIVVGQHVDEIVAESLEAMKRGGPAPVVGTPGSGARSTGRQVESQDGLAAPDQDQLEALTSSGRTADGFAQRLGYQSWSDYMLKTQVEVA